MKTKAFLFASRLTTLVLACILTFSLAACGSDDDEPSVDELLSKETTPITFDLNGGTHFLFDFAGNKLVGTDTIDVEYSSQKSCKIDLRQGKHHLLWMKGLSGSSERWGNGKTKGVDYDVATNMVTSKYWDNDFSPLPQYCLKDIEATPYLLPNQTLDYQPLCAGLEIILECDIQIDDVSKTIILNFPYVTGVGLEDNRCTIGESGVLYLNYEGISNRHYLTQYNLTLCPKDGIDDVELSCKVNDRTFNLPKISLRRGYVTRINGFFSEGNSGDFSVTMHQ